MGGRRREYGRAWNAGPQTCAMVLRRVVFTHRIIKGAISSAPILSLAACTMYKPADFSIVSVKMLDRSEIRGLPYIGPSPPPELKVTFSGRVDLAEVAQEHRLALQVHSGFCGDRGAFTPNVGGILGPTDPGLFANGRNLIFSSVREKAYYGKYYYDVSIAVARDARYRSPSVEKYDLRQTPRAVCFEVVAAGMVLKYKFGTVRVPKALIISALRTP